MEKLNYPLVWSDEFSIQIVEIDDQHKHFVGILNNLYLAVQNNEIESKIESILKELVSYTIVHFATEENYFELYHFSGTEEHKIQHKELLGKVESFVQRFTNEGTNIVPELLIFLENWLLNHLNVYDKKYVECFKQNGLE